ncbi:MAG: chemotaxis protein CheD [Lachnospiraceae bacterium]|jgi:chemotaxis protein CheD|nr:chemotaxis protein CheD [Lachnospiraceae bacterium]MCI8994179.1 chemotaxis protein CheD [Lachnospiraceae bacterium]MCI9133489.1 chemotaxis protein CheD [Lachnospiraceae bacterium]
MGMDLKVGIGDMKFARGDGIIITYALGSCIGITLYDPAIRLGGLLHIMLPARTDPNDPKIYKYADSGLHEMIRKLSAFGMVKSRTIVKIAGGAKMFEIRGNSDFGNIGQRNAAMVKKILMEERMRISAEDTGGNSARTMLLNVGNGDVIIRSAGKPEKHL